MTEGEGADGAPLGGVDPSIEKTSPGGGLPMAGGGPGAGGAESRGRGR